MKTADFRALLEPAGDAWLRKLSPVERRIYERMMRKARREWTKIMDEQILRAFYEGAS